jgi:hypothetical protein
MKIRPSDWYFFNISSIYQEGNRRCSQCQPPEPARTGLTAARRTRLVKRSKTGRDTTHQKAEPLSDKESLSPSPRHPARKSLHDLRVKRLRCSRQGLPGGG